MTDDQVLALCRPIEGWMYDSELLWLHQQARSRRIIVEIGVWKGRSTAALASATPGYVYAVDHWQGSPGEEQTFHAELQTPEGQEAAFQAAKKNLAGLPVCLLRMPSSAAPARLLSAWPIDLLFLDGGHDYPSVAADLDIYLPLLAETGLACGHDYTWPGVQRAVNERFGDRVRRGPGSLWYVEPPP